MGEYETRLPKVRGTGWAWTCQSQREMLLKSPPIIDEAVLAQVIHFSVPAFFQRCHFQQIKLQLAAQIAISLSEYALIAKHKFYFVELGFFSDENKHRF